MIDAIEIRLRCIEMAIEICDDNDVEGAFTLARMLETYILEGKHEKSD